jgi:hypothetical protein
VFQHVRQRLAEVAAGIETGALLDAGDLAPQIRNAVRRARVGGGGEQPDNAEFADQVSRRVESLDADIVEIDAPVHLRMDIGLGDDQRARFLQERHDLRRDLKQVLAAAQHAQVGRAHDAERRFQIGLQAMAGQNIIADAEEGEIVGQQPLQELNRLGDLIDRQRRRIGLQFGDDGIDALEHRPPVGHRQPHLAEHAAERVRQFTARGFVTDRLEMDVNEALARAARGIGGAQRDERAAVAPHAEDRVRHQLHIEPPLADFAHHRIDQKRHVVIGDFDHGDDVALARRFQRDGLAANLRHARLPLLEEIERALGQVGEIGGRVAQHVLGHRAAVKLRDEISRNVGPAFRQFGGGQRDRSSMAVRIFTFRTRASRATHHLVTRP